MNNEERWQAIPNYKGLYEVSSLGRVRSLNYRKTGKTQILKLVINKKGYLQVELWKEGKKKNYKVHRLVAEAFLENPQNLPQVNHLDENKQNNNVENLEYCDLKYNCNYGTRNERMGKAKNKKVICLELNKIFESAKEAAEYLDYSRGSLSAAITKGYKVRGLTFKYITIRIL